MIGTGAVGIMAAFVSRRLSCQSRTAVPDGIGCYRPALRAVGQETIFRDGAPESVLREAEQRLGQALPSELAALLAESDGVEGEYGLGLVWSIETTGTTAGRGWHAGSAPISTGGFRGASRCSG